MENWKRRIDGGEIVRYKFYSTSEFRLLHHRESEKLPHLRCHRIFFGMDLLLQLIPLSRYIPLHTTSFSRPALTENGDIIVGTLQGSVYRLDSSGTLIRQLRYCA